MQKFFMLGKIKKAADYRVYFWEFAIFLLTIFHIFMSWRWSHLDNSPPRWDESGYILQSTVMYKSLMKDGLASLIFEVFNYDRGRVNLITLLVQPFFILFGPTVDSAMISLHMCWIVLGFSFYGICREISKSTVGSAAGFFSFLFFSFYYFTTELSNYFLVEFYLVSSVILFNYILLLFYKSNLEKWGWLLGISIGIGLLIKVTFAIFILSFFILIIVRLIQKESIVELIKKLLPVFIGVSLVAGPYYIYNYSYIIRSTAFLSSRSLADLYGFGEVFKLDTIINYWEGVFFDPLLIISSTITLIVLISIWKIHSKKGIWPRFVLMQLFLWFIIPFIVATFGTIKDPRYIYPALVPLFIGAGFGISKAHKSKLVAIGFAFFVLIIPLYQFSVSHAFFGRQYNYLDKHIKFAQSIDTREWQVSELVSKMNQSLNLKNDEDKKSILILGGNRYYHMNLLRYTSLLNKYNNEYHILPYHNFGMNFNDAVDFIKELQPSGVIYKTGENWPDFAVKYDKEIINMLEKSEEYSKIDLGVVQPDGSRFYMFVREQERIPVSKQQFLEIPIDNDSLMIGIDEVQIISNKNQNVIRVSGWAFVKTYGAIGNKIFIVLSSEEDSYVFDTNLVIRPDITKAFALNSNINLDNSGFETYLPGDLIKNGRYKIGIYIQRNNSAYYSGASTYFSKSGNHIITEYLSDRKDIILPNEAQQITYGIDFIKEIKIRDQEFIKINGWAFTNGQNSLENSIFIVLKSNTKTFIFDTGLLKRPDITEKFGKMKDLNLDDSGFTASIPKYLISNDRYQLGIYIRGLEKKSFQMIKNYIDK